jgi:SnoaL-like domain
MVAPFEDVIDELEARVRIEEALYRHSRGLDRGDPDDQRAAFHPDAVIAFDERTQAIEQVLAANTTSATPQHSMNVVANLMIEFITSNLAFVESYVLSNEIQGADADLTVRGIDESGPVGTRIITWSRNADIFELRDGEWRIRERTTITGDRCIDLLDTPPAIPATYQVQQHGPTDPMFAVLDRARHGR